MIYDIVILSDRNYVKASDDPLFGNIFLEDDLVKQALIRLGLKAERLSWDDPDFDWSQTRSVLFRSTWDYFERFDEFSTWLKAISRKTRLFNSKDIIYWNIDKHYLIDLSDKGINIAETHYIEKGEKTSLKQLYAELGWQETVLKPCVSGTARHTYRLNLTNIEAHEAIFKKLIAEESMMLSPFQHDIVDTGERSLVMLNGEYSHAVLKVAKKGDFRVQDNFGGTVHIYQPTPLEVEFAQTVAKACPELPIYARVDIFTDNNGALAVLEVELVEPELWFRNNPKSADVLAKALKETLNANQENP